MSNDARPNGTIQRPHQRSIQHNWFLRFHNIRRSAPCRTLEEQFHLPALFVDLRDGQRRKREVVGQKLKPIRRTTESRSDPSQRPCSCPPGASSAAASAGSISCERQRRLS